MTNKKPLLIALQLSFLAGLGIIFQASTCEILPRDEMYYVYTSEYPRDRDAEWAENVQGVTHDNDHWYITQTRTLWKIPLDIDINEAARNTQNVQIIDLKDIPQLWDLGYDHFGDLSYYNYQKGTYLLVPLEDDRRNEPDGAPGAIAIFDARTLAYIDHAEINLKAAPWCAVDPDGFLYTSETGTDYLKISVDWNTLFASNQLFFGVQERITLLDETGNPVEINTPQGGVISPGGRLLYISAGLDAIPGFDFNAFLSWGIHVFDLESNRRIKRSLNGKGPFNYEFNPGPLTWEEPEGMTIWDLDDKGPEQIIG